MKVIYGDKVNQLISDQLMAFTELDTYDSGDDDYAVDENHHGVLDSDQGEFDLS